tara:strand:+ start:13017 stop:13796 length:780 start_codon:yes stop_codon:yes gene_type:complete
MKTAIDAVNELKGEWVNVQLHSGRWYINQVDALSHEGGQVCTRQKFLATVAECETNFGKCEQSYSDYAIAFVSMDNLNKSFSDKELDMDIDWSKAPEGATHCWANMNSFYKFSKHDTDFVWQNCEWQKCSDIGCFEGELTEKPQPTPIYTQEMADNGSPLAVGMSAIIRGETRVILLPADCDGDYITKCKGGLYEFDSINQFKPLTPPIKLMDGEAYQFLNEGSTIEKGIYYDGVLINQHGNTALMLCTNIQPLTVEVK